ncbi:MAG: DUF4190 domain-containing protein [Thermoleophilia bacterium]|jgi:hypothetical protein
MKCPNCHAELLPGKLFCRRCGSSSVDTEIRSAGVTGNDIARPIKVNVVKMPAAAVTSPMAPAGNLPSMSQQNFCHFHRDQMAVSSCFRCGRPICAGCVRNYNGVYFCCDCAWNMPPPSFVDDYPALRMISPMKAPLNAYAIASLVTSLLGMWLLAIPLGHVAIGQIKRSNGQEGGRGMALAGLIFGYGSLILIFIPIMLFVFRVSLF